MSVSEFVAYPCRVILCRDIGSCSNCLCEIYISLSSRKCAFEYFLKQLGIDSILVVIAVVVVTFLKEYEIKYIGPNTDL